MRVHKVYLSDIMADLQLKDMEYVYSPLRPNDLIVFFSAIFQQLNLCART